MDLAELSIQLKADYEKLEKEHNRQKYALEKKSIAKVKPYLTELGLMKKTLEIKGRNGDLLRGRITGVEVKPNIAYIAFDAPYVPILNVKVKLDGPKIGVSGVVYPKSIPNIVYFSVENTDFTTFKVIE